LVVAVAVAVAEVLGVLGVLFAQAVAEAVVLFTVNMVLVEIGKALMAAPAVLALKRLGVGVVLTIKTGHPAVLVAQEARQELRLTTALLAVMVVLVVLEVLLWRVTLM